MTLNDVLADPSFAGLHWSIDRDTPWEEREAAHCQAAITAKYLRDSTVKLKKHHPGPYDPENRMWLCCHKSDLELQMNRIDGCY